MPSASVQRKASTPRETLLEPTMTEPSAEVAYAPLPGGLPGNVPSRTPRPSIPSACVQRNACSWNPGAEVTPTTTEPSPEVAYAMLRSPETWPRPTDPPASVQRTASSPDGGTSVSPTTTDPSRETPRASLAPISEGP